MSQSLMKTPMVNNAGCWPRYRGMAAAFWPCGRFVSSKAKSAATSWPVFASVEDAVDCYNSEPTKRRWASKCLRTRLDGRRKIDAKA